MKVSVNTIKRYIDFELPATAELAERINAQLGAIEEIIDLSAKYKGIIVARVADCRKHENSDHLNVCLIDDGGKAQNVERNEQGYVQVVCGAANVREGLFVAWLPPGSTVPESFDKDPFVLGSRALRGEMSNGMLASPRELALGDDHDGILEITTADLPEEAAELKPGDDFAEVFGLNDTIIDIENKMFTHRPDLFGQIGVAREISGIFGQTFNKQYDYLDWHWKFAQFSEATGLDLTIFNTAPNEVPRFMAVAVDNVTVQQSPLWLKCELVRLGGKPINNIVDITNYVMLQTAQPTHAYDYDKIRGGRLGARLAAEGEKITLLNGKTYQLSSDDIVIADGEGPVGLAGIMGGGNSEVGSDTKRIILEVANFDMYTIRRSSMRHGIFTDAVTRFNKGQSPIQNDRVMSRLLQDMATFAGGVQASNVLDEVSDKTRQQISVNAVHKEYQIVSPKFINERLGLTLGGKELEQILRNVNFACFVDADAGHTDEISFAPPFFRTDIEQPEDIVEEIGRLYGFDKLPLELPKRTISPTQIDAMVQLKRDIRAYLSRSGANEVLTYSFVHGDLLQKVGQDKELAFEVGNALSPDLQYYRLSITPSLLDKIHMNIKAGHDEFALFELGKIHATSEIDDDGTVRELGRLGFVFAANKRKQGAFYEAKNYAQELLATGLQIASVTFKPLDEAILQGHQAAAQLTQPYDAARSVFVFVNDKLAGVLGELKASVRKSLKLPVATAAFELFLQPLLNQQNTKPLYSPLSKFPQTEQDITLKVPVATAYGDLFNVVHESLSAQINTAAADFTLMPLDIYHAEGSDTKNVTLRLSVSHHEKTLTDAEVNKLLEVTATDAAKVQAVRV